MRKVLLTGVLAAMAFATLADGVNAFGRRNRRGGCGNCDMQPATESATFVGGGATCAAPQAQPQAATTQSPFTVVQTSESGRLTVRDNATGQLYAQDANGVYRPLVVVAPQQ